MEVEIFTIENCPIRNILDRFGDKWSILVIMVLKQNGVMRFNELNKAIPDISQKMLTVTLRTLEADGLLQRTVYAQVPPKVEYQITEMGLSLMNHISGLIDWAVEHTQTINQSRKEFTKKVV